MKGRVRTFIVVCAAVVFFGGCIEEAPITGRKQLLLVPASQLNALSLQQYGDFLKKNKLSQDAEKVAMVKRVGERVRLAVEKYFRDRGQTSHLNGYSWQFNLVESDEQNAWCMPGGRVVVYTGILPLAGDENGLAVIMGHEIAHAVAGHGRERMSQTMLVSLGGLALSQAVKNKPKQTQALFLTVFGAAGGLGILKYSRIQEYEADHLGLIFMAMAGYDPRAAVPLWERMAKSGGKRPPVFLSTHPAPQSRINRIKTIMPRAMAYYEHAESRTVVPETKSTM